MLDVPNPPFRSGRYHLSGGRPTWYGSSSEEGAWAEFARSLPEGVDPSQFRRRLGHVEFDLLVLDLTSTELQKALGIRKADLVSDDLAVCQTLADLAAEAGFDAVLGPSAATAAESTLAVFDGAIAAKATQVRDLGGRTASTRIKT